MISALQTGKGYLLYLQFIASIKRGEKSIIFGKDYVTLSNKAYDSLINKNHPELEPFSYDDSSMHNWLKKKFLEQDKK